MVAELTRLRLALLANIATGTPARRVGVGIGLLAALVAVIAVSARVLRLAQLDTVVARSEIVIGGSAIVLAFVVVPLLLQRDDPMDPRRFALFGIPGPKLALATAVSSVVALPVVATLVFSVATVLVWSASPLGAVLAVVGALLAVATCVLCGRIFSSVSALVLVTRRAREVAGVVGVFVLVLVAPADALALSLNWGSADTTLGDTVSRMLGFTPLGAAWALPAVAAGGDTGGAFLCFLIAAVTVSVLWVVWRTLVTLMMTSSRRDGAVRAQPAALGWFGSLPSTPAGSIAARSLTYWARDPRYYVPLVIIPIVPIILAIPLIVVQFPLQQYALFPLPIMCLFLGFAVHNDVALDNTAVWLHVVSGKRGIADRFGRIAPVLLLGLPLIGVGSVATVFFAHNSAALPSILGVSTCLLFVSTGLGSLLSARFPYAATRPGESPFTQPQTTGSTSVFVQVGIVVGTLALASPSLYFAIVALTPGGIAAAGSAAAGSAAAGVAADGLTADSAYWSSLWWGVLVGVAVLVLGGVAGGAVFNRRGPEILATSVRG
ncbi:ABC transporter permease [Subtercola boreus]|uniref:Uncharacterized protein n=1 Tax=Subtercola boreus TaxID=120213 RepID=A0A3E0WAW7_9MICO|nr:ABC transporter permease [Subtercola boreus]RFA20345.1 hypothetical protein B7R24_10115 [Subtercola boreus]RFA20499.1 hypothetical protein B7R23_10055 [Subtercola boreus]RFA26748.1 hypothetical protein B7R25_10180 [Subtercola boreus]